MDVLKRVSAPAHLPVLGWHWENVSSFGSWFFSFSSFALPPVGASPAPWNNSDQTLVKPPGLPPLLALGLALLEVISKMGALGYEGDLGLQKWFAGFAGSP